VLEATCGDVRGVTLRQLPDVHPRSLRLCTSGHSPSPCPPPPALHQRHAAAAQYDQDDHQLVGHVCVVFQVRAYQARRRGYEHSHLPTRPAPRQAMAQRPFDCPPHRMRRHTPCPCRLQVTPGSAASPSRRERAPWPSPGTGEPHVRWLDGGNLRGRVARRPSDARTFRRLPWRSLIRARLRFLSSSSTRCCCAAKLASSSLPLFALPRCLTVFAGGMPARRCNSHQPSHSLPPSCPPWSHHHNRMMADERR
jgi:hypothetical protein